MKYSLNQSQQQKMILSPQIRQYLKLLQLPVAELAQSINEELIENPMLDEKEEFSAKSSDSESPDIKKSDTPKELESQYDFSRTESLRDDFWSDFQSSYSSGKSGLIDAQRLKDFQETNLSQKQSLYEYLLWQIKFLDFTPVQLKIAEEIIGNIDEHGYLKETSADLAAVLKVNEENIEEVLESIQELDPPGVGSRNLQEALIKQLKKDSADTAIEQEIIAKHINLVQKRDWKHLSKILDVSMERMRIAERKISRLEPKPGRAFYSEEANSVVPEAIIYFTGDDKPKLKMEFLDERMPKLRINTYYRNMMKNENMDKKAKAYLQEKLQKATDFLKALDQRKSTLHLITEQIMKDQTPFFSKGFSHLKPLRLKDIADEIGIHESTVSRAIQNKFMQTPQGTIAYRSFFSTKLETNSGEDESQRSIMQLLKKIIHEENPEHPLSDQQIVTTLNEKGIKIARRTVAKYRDVLKILPSHLRRQK
jgi:RNA polymerase sigma-54 factor